MIKKKIKINNENVYFMKIQYQSTSSNLMTERIINFIGILKMSCYSIPK